LQQQVTILTKKLQTLPFTKTLPLVANTKGKNNEPSAVFFTAAVSG